MEFNLADLFEVVVDTVPDRLALVAGTARLSYRQLDARANQLAHHLAGAGVRPGDSVAIYSRNRAEWTEAMLAAFKVRAIPINVNYRYVAEELAYLLEDSDATCLIHERHLTPEVEAVAAELPLLAHRVVLEDGSDWDATPAVPYEAALAAALPTRGFEPRSPDDLYVLYTGGTTGMPKGVMWRQEDIFFAAMGGGGFGQEPIKAPEQLAERVAAGPGSSHVVTAPMMHGGGQWVSFINFFAGNTVVLYCGTSYDPHEVWRLVQAERASSVMIVGDAMGRPLAEALAEAGGSYDLSSLQVVGSGGAILSPAVKEQLRARLPGVAVIDSFGASETGAGGSVLDLDQPAAGPRFKMGEYMSVLDEGGRPVRPGSGQVGRLARRGHIPLGYHKDPDKTAQSFLTDPEGVRWVLPGDHALVEADGTIVVLGRGAVCINTGGEKVFPEEVEAALKAHPAVADAVVVGVPDVRFGERVAAVVRPRPARVPSLGELAEHCRRYLAGYKVPRQLVLVDSVVRTPAGKPDYRWAKAAAQEGVAG